MSKFSTTTDLKPNKVDHYVTRLQFHIVTMLFVDSSQNVCVSISSAPHVARNTGTMEVAF